MVPLAASQCRPRQPFPVFIVQIPARKPHKQRNSQHRPPNNTGTLTAAVQITTSAIGFFFVENLTSGAWGGVACGGTWSPGGDIQGRN